MEGAYCIYYRGICFYNLINFYSIYTYMFVICWCLQQMYAIILQGCAGYEMINNQRGT